MPVRSSILACFLLVGSLLPVLGRIPCLLPSPANFQAAGGLSKPSSPGFAFLQTSERPAKMAKSKNHTNHNQNKKAHKNGIKKPPTSKYPSLRGVDPKMRRNSKYAKIGSEKALRESRHNKMQE